MRMTRHELVEQLWREGLLRTPPNDLPIPDPVLTLELDGRLGAPRFQFDPAGALWPGLIGILTEFRRSGWDDVDIAGWFVSPQGSADGAVPAEILSTRPEAVAEAARSTLVA